MDGQVKVIDQGSQFKGLWSNIGFALLVISFACFVVLIKNEFRPIALVFLPLGYVGFELMKNKRGLILDKVKGEYLAYTETFGVKRGEWQSLSSYDRIILIKDYYSLNVGPSTVPFLRGNKKRVSSYDVLLKGPNDDEVFVKECSTHQEAQRHLNEVSTYLSLPSEDRLKATLDQLQERRRKSGRR